jgi:hypothetical protein
MSPKGVREQFADLIERLISSSISVKQFSPSVRTVAGGDILIGRRASSSIALRDVSYDDAYKELEANEAYDIKLVDGGLLLLQYRFNAAEKLLQHRLAYFPSPALPTVDEAPELYEQDALYGDIIDRRLVRFPIRFDFAPEQHADLVHPACHMTLGQYESCRIPVSGPMGPSAFCMFIVRNFYCRAYTKHKNSFDRRFVSLDKIESITNAERRLSHFVHGR